MWLQLVDILSGEMKNYLLREVGFAPEHICENQAFIYTYSKQIVLSFGNDLATESNANVLSEILY